MLPFKYLLTKRAKINVLTLIIVVPGNMDCLSIFGWSICWQDSYHHLENTHSADDGSDVPKFIKKISSRTRFKTSQSPKLYVSCWGRVGVKWTGDLNTKFIVFRLNE